MMMVSHPTFLSKTPTETYKFIWKIANFAHIRSSKQLVESQRLQFEMASIGLPTKWKCYLQCEEDNGKNWIGVIVEFDKASAQGYEEVWARFGSMKIGGGEYFKGAPGVTVNRVSEPARGYPKAIPQKDDGRVLPLDEDGSLSVEVEMALFNLKASVNLEVKQTLSSLESEFGAKFRATFQNDMLNMFKNLLDPSSSAPMTVKVLASDGKEILASSGILSARSPVFLSLFQSQMSEVQEGVIKVNDVSGPALQALLSFMHTGILPANWKEPGIMEGFIYAAHKYLLQELVDFLDQAFGMVVCSTKTCVKLVELAEKLDMKRAEKELTRVLKDQMKDASLGEMRQLFEVGDPDEEMCE